MTFASTALLAIGMSMDAFAAAVGKGAALHKPKWREALRTGAIFGLIETITPVLGWALGLAAAQYVTAWDHWIAFTVLTLLGLRMIWSGCSPRDEEAPKASRHGFWLLVATAFATSIDALAIGVGIAFLDMDILPAALAIGFATMVMVTAGVMLGRVLGAMAGRRAEILGGIMLIGIGGGILYQHMTAV